MLTNPSTTIITASLIFLLNCFLLQFTVLRSKNMRDKQPINAKEKQYIEQQSYLPDDLIINEIVTRLPIKSILRFMSVSKQWYSTLSSSKFATFLLMKSPLSHPSSPLNTLFIECWKDFYLFSYDDDDDDDDDQNPCSLEDNLVKLVVDFGVNDDYLKLIGCCNGLVCLSRPLSDYFILWNPATRKLHKYSSDEYLERIHDVALGFGYASSVDDYKYVRILTLGWESGQGSNIAYIFSLRESKWRKIEFDHDVVVRPYGKPVLLDEKLYWASYIKHVGSVIVCFDLGLEKFDIIRLNVADSVYLGVMGAHLCVSKYDSTDRGDNELKIIQKSGSSTIEKSIDLPKEMTLDTDSQMIGDMRTGSFFVTGDSYDVLAMWRIWRKGLWLVEIGMKPMQCIPLLKVHKLINIARYVPSLVSPFPIEDLSEA